MEMTKNRPDLALGSNSRYSSRRYCVLHHFFKEEQKIKGIDLTQRSGKHFCLSLLIF
jgi:hypothetical protein